MTGNMLLEDVLAILGRVGTVQLRKGTNDVSATPGHKADTEGWTCELTVAGYLSPYSHGYGGSPLILGRRTSAKRGRTAAQAARDTLEELERFLASDKGRKARECYMRDYEGAVARAGEREPGTGWHRRHPGPPIPEAVLNYGD